MRRPVLPAILLVCVLAATMSSPALAMDGPQRTLRHAVMVRVPFNDEAAFLGLTYEFIALPSLGIGITVGGDGRLTDDITRQRIRPHFLIQRKETHRTFLFMGAEKILTLDRLFAVYAGGGAGYSWGNYAGTRTDPGNGWTPTAEVGVQIRWLGKDAMGQVRLGYQYADVISHPANRAIAAVGVAF